MALVGSSGCGKSTLVELLLRYYNQERGEVRLFFMNISWNGKNLKVSRNSNLDIMQLSHTEILCLPPRLIRIADFCINYDRCIGEYQ